MANDFLIKFENDSEESEERNIWTTQRVEDYISATDEGIDVKGGSPFYDRNPSLKRGNILWSYTEEEKNEIRKCARDISYFANKYATVMTDDGLQTISLRDYQDELLNTFVANRFNVCLASRQIGKCFAFYSDIYIKKDGIEQKIKLYDLWHSVINIKLLPFKLKLIHYSKYYLYRLYNKLDLYEKGNKK